MKAILAAALVVYSILNDRNWDEIRLHPARLDIAKQAWGTTMRQDGHICKHESGGDDESRMCSR